VPARGAGWWGRPPPPPPPPPPPNPPCRLSLCGGHVAPGLPTFPPLSPPALFALTCRAARLSAGRASSFASSVSAGRAEDEDEGEESDGGDPPSLVLASGSRYCAARAGAPASDSHQPDGDAPAAVAVSAVSPSLDGAAADVWSLGVTMVATVLGFFPPWATAHASDAGYAGWCAAWAVADGDGTSVSAAGAQVLGALLMPSRGVAGGPLAEVKASPAFLDLVVRMLYPHQAGRASLPAVAAHPWMVSSRV
jgi:hypothetical protein